MNEKQKRDLLAQMRNVNIASIKAFDEGNKKLNVDLGHYTNGFTTAIYTLFGDEGEEFMSIFMECECGHNFSLTGNETDEELEKHYSYMDAYYKFEGENK
jgi:hypothetical protein